MPIYEQAYRRYEGRAPLRTVRFWPITREALRLLLARRAFIVLFMTCALPFAGFCIYLYALTQLPEIARRLPVGGPLFDRFFGFQTTLAFLLTTFAGAGLVASDRATGGMVVYLSRPLTRRDYVAGKLAVLLGLNLSITLVPALLLYGVALALLPGQLLTREHAWLAPSVAAQGLAISAVISAVALAVSALSKSARAAGLAFFGLLVTLDLVQAILSNIYDRPHFALLSPQASLRSLADSMLGGSPPLPWFLPALVLAALTVACLTLVRRQVRAVEIVT